MAKRARRHCVRSPETGKFAPASSAVAALKTKAAPSFKKNAAPASKAKAALASKTVAAEAAKRMAAKERTAGKKPLKNATQESTPSSSSVVEMCRHCYEGKTLCLNWLYGNGKCMKQGGPCVSDCTGPEGHEISQSTLMESLNAVVTKPLMESVRALAWKVDDLKEKVERNNDLNAKMDAFGVLLVAVTDKMAALRKVLDSTLASHKK